ncbi:MAG: hypothetical protein NTW14_00790 [bacterium]|nr:hypothetical protein [bacterium]
MANPASALGEAIGLSVEQEIQKIIQKIVEPYGLYVDVGGKRSGKREKEKLLLINETGNAYQIDTVIEDRNGNPLILVESKYLRYKKHNRDKASWTCVAHYKLRTTYPSVKKSIAILMGNWSRPSLKLMKSFGVEILEIPFSDMVEVLEKHQINFNWSEDDSTTPRKSWVKYCKLSTSTRKEIGRQILLKYKNNLESMILEAVQADPDKPKNVDKIELLIKTTHNEFYVKNFTSIKDSLKYMLGLIVDPSDLEGLL